MFTITSGDLDSFLLGIQKWHQETALEAIQVYRGVAVTLFNYVTYETPQWTGSAAANWNISAGAPDFSVDLSLKMSNTSERASKGSARNLSRTRFGSPVAQKGDERAIQLAASRNAGKFAGLVTFAPIFLVNAAKGLQGDAYARLLEENPNNYLRPENEPGHMLANAYAAVSMKFALISEADANQLKIARIGDDGHAGVR